jgi:hypothetical protein
MPTQENIQEQQVVKKSKIAAGNDKDPLLDSGGFFISRDLDVKVWINY